MASMVHYRSSYAVAGRREEDSGVEDHGDRAGGCLQRCLSSSAGAAAEARSPRQDPASRPALEAGTKRKMGALMREAEEVVDEDLALAGTARVHGDGGRLGDGEPTAREALGAARREADADKAAAAQDGEDLTPANGVRR